MEVTERDICTVLGFLLPTLRCAGQGWAARATVVPVLLLGAGYFLIKERSTGSCLENCLKVLLQGSLLSFSKVCRVRKSKGKGEGFV